MIKINNQNYSGRKIVISNLYEGDMLELSSDSTNITWKIVKYPTVQNSVEAFFHISNRNPSTHNIEYMLLELTGTYVIEATERSGNGNYSKVTIYVRSNSRLVNVSLPFNGETIEISDNGYSHEILQYLTQLTNLVEPLIITTYDGGRSQHNGNENILNGGYAFTQVWGTIIDGGRGGTTINIIDGGSAIS